MLLRVFFRFVLQRRPKILNSRGRPNWTASVERWAHLNPSVSSYPVVLSLSKLSYPIHNSPRFNENKVLIWIGFPFKWNVVESEWCSTYISEIRNNPINWTILDLWSFKSDGCGNSWHFLHWARRWLLLQHLQL